MLNIGDDAPDFSVSDQSGETVTLSELRGKTVVLFFYPKADTPGCTVEACSFRDKKADYDADDVMVFGISPDTSKAQSKFAEKFGLPYRLLADADHAIAESYGVWAEKSMYGKKYMGVDRTTFVIGKDGKLTQVFHKVKPENHADEVLAAIKAA